MGIKVNLSPLSSLQMGGHKRIHFSLTKARLGYQRYLQMKRTVCFLGWRSCTRRHEVGRWDGSVFSVFSADGRPWTHSFFPHQGQIRLQKISSNILTTTESRWKPCRKPETNSRFSWFDEVGRREGSVVQLANCHKFLYCIVILGSL